MIFGRPVNLWLGLTTAVSGAVVATLIALGFDPVIIGTLGGVWTGVLGAVILLIANQPPTVAAGGTAIVQTQPNELNRIVTLTSDSGDPIPE